MEKKDDNAISERPGKIESNRTVFSGPVIPAVASEEALALALEADAACFFLLFGDILTLPTLCREISARKKTCFVHADFIEGLSGRDIAVDFIASLPSVRGIISTRPNLIRRAGASRLLSVERFFILDSRALLSATKRLEQSHADFVEILPGVAWKAIRRVKDVSAIPLIAGGLIETKAEVSEALSAGADFVSTSNPELWVNL